MSRHASGPALRRYAPGAVVCDACWDGDNLVVACADGVRRLTDGCPRVVGPPADLVACSRSGCLATALDNAVTVGGQTRVFAEGIRQIVWDPAGHTLAVLADGVHLWEAGVDPQRLPRPLRSTLSITRIAWADELFMSGPGVYAFRDGKKVRLTPHRGVNALTAHGSRSAYADTTTAYEVRCCQPEVSRVYQNGQLLVDYGRRNHRYVSSLALAHKYLAMTDGYRDSCAGELGTNGVVVVDRSNGGRGKLESSSDSRGERKSFSDEDEYSRGGQSERESSSDEETSESYGGGPSDWPNGADNRGLCWMERTGEDDEGWYACSVGHIEPNSLQWNANATKLLWRTKSLVYVATVPSRLHHN